MADWSLGWPAPAKLNLMLRILGRRADGYHLLQTVFQFLDRADTLDFLLRQDGLIRRLEGCSHVSEANDLSVRAAQVLQPFAKRPGAGVDIRLHKLLPIGGGLGGGSSDAATTLVALNRLWECELDHSELARLGLSLGADVPVFVHGHAAWAEGVGEQLQAIELPEDCYLVLEPPCHVSTADVFNDPDLTRDSHAIKIRAFVAGDRVNDCLAVVRKKYPEVDQAIDWLGDFSEARLTGTGACVFAVFSDEGSANQVLAQRPAIFGGFVARGRNRSPLLDRLHQPD